MHPPRRPYLKLVCLLGLWLLVALGSASCGCGAPAEPQCTAKGQTCTKSDSCCTGFCSRDKCLCMPDEGGCTKDDQCCSGTCEGDKCKATT